MSITTLGPLQQGSYSAGRLPGVNPAFHLLNPMTFCWIPKVSFLQLYLLGGKSVTGIICKDAILSEF